MKIARVPSSTERRVVLSLAPSALSPDVAFDDAAPRTPVVVLSGPEGGLAPAEESAALARDFVPVNLGPRVLRADTAPLALLAWLCLRAPGASGTPR